MPPIVMYKTREIIDDFAKAIQEKKVSGSKPSKAVINFRNEKRDGIEREVVLVPINLLRYRKENGRIASDVIDYEKRNGLLDENTDDCQRILRNFLEKKDPEKTENLRKAIEHDKQNEHAIITCDGFLINGNRRKMVFEQLNERYPGQDFEYLKVIILPGKNDDGGAPTVKEIEQLENRYQLQTDGKSEYYGFDRALSIKRKIELGFTLREQLADDPQYANATAKQLDAAENEIMNEYLRPLECVDRYLRQFEREGLYSTVSSGYSDREGRWEAFKDYSKTYYGKFSNQKWRIENDLEEDDIGRLEEAAFQMIRMRQIEGQGKIHRLMRLLPKVCAEKDSRKEILKMSDRVENTLPRDECVNKEGEPLSIDDIERKWVHEHRKDIIWGTKKAFEILDNKEAKETPLTLLEAALKKLEHEELQMDSIRIIDLPRARDLASRIQQRAHAIERDIYQHEKNVKSLANKK